MSVRIMVQLTCEGCGEVWEPATVDGSDDIYCATVVLVATNMEESILKCQGL